MLISMLKINFNFVKGLMKTPIVFIGVMLKVRVPLPVVLLHYFKRKMHYGINIYYFDGLN